MRARYSTQKESTIMRMKYIETMGYVRKDGRLIRGTNLYLGFVVNEEFSTYQIYDSNDMVGYWHIIHNKTGYSIARVKDRKNINTVLDRFDVSLFNFAYVTDAGFLEWRSANARFDMRQAWQALKDEGLIA